MKVEIFISDISKITTKTRVDDGILVTAIQFEARVPVPSIARLLNLQRQGAPISAMIGSPQASMDLQFSETSGKRSAAAEVDR